MTATSSLAASLLQAGALLAVVLLGQAVALRHLSAETIPTVLRARVELSNRLRPWLLGAAVALALAGLLLHVR